MVHIPLVSTVAGIPGPPVRHGNAKERAGDLAEIPRLRDCQFAGKTSHEFAGENDPPLR
jgi:hypothetical protein